MTKGPATAHKKALGASTTGTGAKGKKLLKKSVGKPKGADKSDGEDKLEDIAVEYTVCHDFSLCVLSQR